MAPQLLALAWLVATDPYHRAIDGRPQKVNSQVSSSSQFIWAPA